MTPTIKLRAEGRGFKVELHEGTLTNVHYFDDYSKALIKAAVLRIKHTQNKISPIFTNEVKERVQTS